MRVVNRGLGVALGFHLILARALHLPEAFLRTGLQAAGTLPSRQSQKIFRRGGSNCVRLESRSNVRSIGMKEDVRSIFVTRQAMLLNWPLQPYGVAVGILNQMRQPSNKSQGQRRVALSADGGNAHVSPASVSGVAQLFR